MKKIIASIRPFDMQQHLYVFEDGEKIDEATVSLSDVENTVLELQMLILQVQSSSTKRLVKD